MQAVNVKLAVGSFVWVEDPEVAWIDGEVVGVNGEEVEINCTSGKTVRLLLKVFINLVVIGDIIVHMIKNCMFLRLFSLAVAYFIFLIAV